MSWRSVEIAYGILLVLAGLGALRAWWTSRAMKREQIEDRKRYRATQGVPVVVDVLWMVTEDPGELYVPFGDGGNHFLNRFAEV